MWHAEDRERALLIVFAVCCLLTQVIGYVDYLLNEDFILANLSALPFRYKVALGYGPSLYREWLACCRPYQYM